MSVTPREWDMLMDRLDAMDKALEKSSQHHEDDIAVIEKAIDETAVKIDGRFVKLEKAMVDATGLIQEAVTRQRRHLAYLGLPAKSFLTYAGQLPLAILVVVIAALILHAAGLRP